jgi:hypothetical protein
MEHSIDNYLLYLHEDTNTEQIFLATGLTAYRRNKEKEMQAAKMKQMNQEDKDLINDKEDKVPLLKRPKAVTIATGVHAGIVSGGLGYLMFKVPGVGTLGKIALSLAIASQVMHFANVVYKLHYSKAAKLCKDNKYKLACMEEYYIKAINEKIKVLKAGIPKCKYGKDPKGCVNELERQIDRLESIVLDKQSNIHYLKSKYY